MWKGKRKFIVIGVLVVVLVAGSITGVAFAQTGSTTASANVTPLLDRVAGILKIDPQTLKNAFTQAQKEQRDQRLNDYLDNLVKQGKMTQADADKYKQWWATKPNVPVPGGDGFGMSRFNGGMRGMMGGHFFGGARPGVPAPKPPTTQQ